MLTMTPLTRSVLAATEVAMTYRRVAHRMRRLDRLLRPSLGVALSPGMRARLTFLRDGERATLNRLGAPRRAEAPHA